MDEIEQESFSQLSPKDLQAQRFQTRSNNTTRKPLKLQVSKPPKNSVKLKPQVIPVHFTWALILTIIAFFTIGPCWALYKTIQLRRMIARQENDEALRLSHKITTILVLSSGLALFLYIAILFCSVGIILAGKLIETNVI